MLWHRVLMFTLWWSHVSNKRLNIQDPRWVSAPFFCMCDACVCAHTHALSQPGGWHSSNHSVPSRTEEGVEPKLRNEPGTFLYLNFWTKIFHWNQSLAWLAGQRVPAICLCSHHSVLDLQMCAAVPGFYMDARDPNSGPRAYTAGTLPDWAVSPAQ